MPRKAVQLVFPDTSFRDDVLSVPGYAFEKVCLVDIVSQKPSNWTYLRLRPGMTQAE